MSEIEKKKALFNNINNIFISNCSKSIDKLNIKEKLSEYIINSIEFIKIIVDIEEYYDIIFSNEELDTENFKDIEGLVDFIYIKVYHDK